MKVSWIIPTLAAALGTVSLHAQLPADQLPTLDALQVNTLKNEPLCRAATIGISTCFGGQGSGVIVHPDGIILTAAHVLGEPGAAFQAYLADGTNVNCIALFVNTETDTAIGRIVDKAPKGGFKFRMLSSAKSIPQGAWCTVISHSGGIQLNRPAPLRIGRVLTNSAINKGRILVTDCVIVTGDSGGPLFDAKGHVCGINSQVEAESALGNFHISSETFLAQWGDYLTGKKSYPTAEETLAAKENADKKAGEKPNALPGHIRQQALAAMAQQYPDLPKAALELILDHSTLVNGNTFSIQASPELSNGLKKLGIDPTKYEIPDFGNGDDKKADDNEEKESPKDEENKEVPQQKKEQPAPPAEEPAAPSVPDRIIEAVLKRKFGENVQEEALKILLAGAQFNKETSTLKLNLTPGDIAKLKKLGVNVMGDNKAPADEDIIKNALKEKFGEDIPDEATKILLSASRFNRETGDVRFQLTPETIMRLKELGLDLQSDGPDLTPIAKQYGKSSDEMLKQFPPLAKPIHLLQDNQRVGLATAIASDGKLLCKSSLLDGDDSVTVSIGEESYPAQVQARDEESDLALIKIETTLKVAPWAQTPALGNIVLSATEATPCLAVVSVNKRVIPKKISYVGNGNTAFLGVSSDLLENGGGAHISGVHPDSPADLGGIKNGDVIIAIAGEEISSSIDLRTRIGNYKGGDVVKLTLLRAEKEIELSIKLQAVEDGDLFPSTTTNNGEQIASSMAGVLSKRRTSFPESFSHDALIWADDCGGPVYVIGGKLVGITIARYSRTTNYALTQKSIDAALRRMNQ